MEIFLMIELMYREKKFQFCKEAMPGSEKKKKKISGKDNNLPINTPSI